MAILPTNLARVSNLLRTSVATSSMTKTQRMLLEVQNQLTTGQRINKPSDDPGDGAIIQQLQKTLEKRQGYLDNISSAKNTLSSVDTSLEGLTDLLRQATQIASANVGSDVTADARTSAAALIDNLYNQSISFGNTQFQGTYIYGGDRSDKQPFVTASNGGVKFVGTNNVLQNTFDDNMVRPFMVSGDEVFGTATGTKVGSNNLSPAITTATRLDALGGATAAGVYKGQIKITNGAANATIDLSSADSIGDVITRINAATGTTDVTAAIAPDGMSLALTAGSGAFSVTEVGGASTARDLGIRQNNPVASLDGADVKAKVTPLTLMSSIFGGGGVDASGLAITNGSSTATVTYTGPITVEAFLNQINAADVGVHAQINAAGTGLEIVNLVAGTELRIGENGGNTATQLGIRTMSPTQQLSELNNGKGVRTVPGADITVTRRDGTEFSVDLDGAATIGDVITKINTAAGSTMASFATTGNGIVMTDASVGPDTSFKVAAANFSSAGEDLGLNGLPATAGVITGKDVSPVSIAGVFTNLAKLRDALRTNDQRGITEASQGISEDLERVISVRGVTGARVQELEGREDRITDENLATQSLLSSLQDTDYTTAITQFSTLQSSLQASLRTTNTVANLSLMDFLS